MRFLELKIPPPVVMIIVAALMWLARTLTPTLELPDYARVATAAAIAVIAATLAITAAFTFRRAKTTTNPFKPEKASSLVTRGAFRFSRNPMYLSLALLLVAWATFLASPLLLLGVVVFVLYMTRFQIHPEEETLSRLFGSHYLTYKTTTRRWL